MAGKQLLFHSPFNPENVVQGEGPSLIVQFILKELIQAKKLLSRSSPPQLAPFDWAWKQGSFYKVAEHASLLETAFPDLDKEAKELLKRLKRPCAELFPLLEPFILACKTRETVLLFLLRHRSHHQIQSMLDKICPEGVEKLKIWVASQYQKRGFDISPWIDSFPMHSHS